MVLFILSLGCVEPEPVSAYYLLRIFSQAQCLLLKRKDIYYFSLGRKSNHLAGTNVRTGRFHAGQEKDTKTLLERFMVPLSSVNYPNDCNKPM